MLRITANNTVYIGSWDSYLYAIDAETGQEKWRFKTGEDTFIRNQQGFQSHRQSQTELFMSAAEMDIFMRLMLRPVAKWDYPTNKGWVNSTPAIRGGVVYAGTSDGYRFFALDANRAGRLKFTLDAKGAVFSSPALAGDMVYVGVSNGRLLAINAKSGKLAWDFQTKDRSATR